MVFIAYWINGYDFNKPPNQIANRIAAEEISTVYAKLVLDISRVQNAVKTPNRITISAKPARCLMKSFPENDSRTRPIFCWHPAVPPGPGDVGAFAVGVFIIEVDGRRKFFDSRSLGSLD